MKKYILSLSILLVALLATTVGFAQVTTTVNCTKPSNCFDFTYKGYVTNVNGTVTLNFSVKVNCGADLSHASFELPAGATATNLSGPGSNQAKNPTNEPFYSVKFEMGSGYKNGETANFSYTITAAQFLAMTTIRAEAKASATVGMVAFNAKGGCEPIITDPTQNCPTSQPRPISGEQHPCPGAIETYCIENDRNYTSFVWDVPRAHAGEPPIGWEIISGQGTNCVTVRVGLKSGTMKVTVQDPICGTKVATLPVKPGKYFEVAITGPDEVCIDEEQTYTAAVTPRQNGHNTDYNFIWTVPVGWTIVSGQGTSNLVVEPNGTAGQVSVYVANEEGRTGDGNNGTGVGNIKANCGSAFAVKEVEVSEDCDLTPLPVELISFKGEATKSGVLLEWSTASEKNNEKFEIERSQNGQTFAKIGEVKGNGNSATQRTYSFRDAKAETGTNYYRLKQLDLDGKFEYSKVVVVTNAASLTSTSAKLLVAPNPVSGGQFSLLLEGIEGGQLQVMDMSGRVLFTQTINPNVRELTLNTQSLGMSSGMYMILVRNNTTSTNTKLIVR
ncbi:T9SS type A sorting domain-containing protein [Adhaeribacter aquaticus]|uniref:T9SS type A sorting domain-containing protein n=1 Tax=Adhaeribacter aquaticus TaxID=299567 RepID=UPI000683ECCE|nr:T9SS type A sorting domain-containing protein [Adhaeribacter aquaticus]